MTNKTNKKEKIPSRFLLTKFNLTARLLVGAYLLYTSYSLIEGVVNGEGRDKYFLGVFMAAFAVIGILMMLFAGRSLLQGKYVGGEMDAGEEEERAEGLQKEEGAQEQAAIEENAERRE